MTQPTTIDTIGHEVAQEEPDEIDKHLKIYAGRPVPPDVLLEVIMREAGLDQDDMQGVPMLDRADLGGGVRWDVFKSPPGGQLNEFVIVCLFMGDQADKQGDHSPGDVRIYVAPRAPTDTQGMPYPHLRYTISRIPGGGATRAILSPRLFLEEASHELEQLAIVCDVLEEEEEDDEEPEETPEVTS